MPSPRTSLAARYDQLDAAVAALLQSHTADRDTAAGYQDEFWQHLRSTSRAIEAAMKELAEDTQRQLQALRGEQLAAQKKRGETEELLNRAACLTDVQTIHDRLVAIEDGAAGLTAEKVRDDFFRLQEQLKDAVAEAEARIQRQLGQESSRRRLVEDRLAEIETDAGDGGRIQPLLAALREEMTDSEHSYRRRLDSQDRILGQLKRQAEDARETSESTRRQLQQLHELLEDTQDKHVRDVSFLEGEVAEVKRFLGLETDNLRRRLQTRAERDHLQALATDHNRFAGEAQLRLDKLEGQAAVLSETATLSELRHQINSNSADVARLKAAAPGAGEIKALKTEIQKELVMLRDSLGSKREADLLQAQQELLESVRDTVMDQVDARLRPLESSNWGAELDSVKVLITKLEKKLGASEDKKKDAADKRELDKLAKELRAVTAELEALRPEVDAATAHAADVRSMFQTFEEEMHRNLPKDLKAHLQKQREEFERLKMELETTMAAAEKRSSFFEDEFARMSNLLTENFDEDEKRANEMRDIQAAVEAQVKRALIDMQALSQACDDQIYEMGKETSSWRDRVAAAERNVMELKGFVEEVSRDRDEPVRLLTERIQMLESQVTLEVQKFRRQYEIATGGASPAASPSALHSAPPLHLPGRRASLTSEMA
ncbi:hypothetical protein DIPPA_16629 [Diplonema papillatum]|nr:hypothetical protein DIPPA_16629 [Diplonema papillatum]